jgi:hypothetical protein
VCLHLCQKDFLQLAQAVSEAAEQIRVATQMNGTARGKVQ